MDFGYRLQLIRGPWSESKTLRYQFVGAYPAFEGAAVGYDADVPGTIPVGNPVAAVAKPLGDLH